MDESFEWPGVRGFWCHLWSDLPGDAGREELAGFLRRLRLPLKYLQHAGTPREYYDLCRGAIERARAAGAARRTTRDYVEAVRARRRGSPG